MTIIGRVKAGVNVRNVNLNTLFQKFNGGGHPKAASATAKLEDESEAKVVLQGLVDELIHASLEQQLTVGDFMQSPVLSAKPTMTEKQVEDLFIRYDVRALPVVNDENEVIGLVSYKEVAAAKVRLMNKQEKRMREIEKAAEQGKALPEARPLESALKGWMKQHVQTVDASLTMAEVENILLETDGEFQLLVFYEHICSASCCLLTKVPLCSPSWLHTCCRRWHQAIDRDGNSHRPSPPA